MSGTGSKQVCLGSDYPRNIGYIEDILANIFSNLPIESLLKCMLVDKFWYNLIREPQFAQLHFSCSRENPELIVYLGGDDSEDRESLHLIDRDGEVTEYVSLPELEENRSLELICSFNGLVFFTKIVGEYVSGIQILNPATGKGLNVPEVDPSAITQSFGVLFDPEKNRYKVLHFFYDALEPEERYCKWEVYTPDSGDWRRISGTVQCPVCNPACPFLPNHLCVGGRMYWLVWSAEDRWTPDYILSIDMDDNISRVELPEDSDGIKAFNILTFLTVYEGRLTCVAVDNDELALDIWTLTDHSESLWSFIGAAELPTDDNIDTINSIVPIENELLFIIKTDAARFFCFQFLNMEDMTWRRSYLAELEVGECEPVACPFTESLFRCDLANIQEDRIHPVEDEK